MTQGDSSKPSLVQVQFTCPQCQNSLRVASNVIGKTVGCPSCGSPVVVPRPATPPPPAVSNVPLPQRSNGIWVPKWAMWAAGFAFFSLAITCGVLTLILLGTTIGKAIIETANKDNVKTGAPSVKTVGSVAEADEEFRIAASQKGQAGVVAAKMLIDFRNNDKWSWENLEEEVDFQFGGIKAEFNQWKQHRISAGDRYK